MTQELLDAMAPGDKAVWDRYLAPECLYAAEDGRTLTKAQLLEELSPLPPGTAVSPWTRTRGFATRIGQRTGRPEEELFARDERTFFRKGSRGEKVFVRDSDGKVQRLIDRRGNNDLVWRRGSAHPASGGVEASRRPVGSPWGPSRSW